MTDFTPHITINSPEQTRGIIRGEERKHWYLGWRQAQLAKDELEKSLRLHRDNQEVMAERKEELEELIVNPDTPKRDRAAYKRELRELEYEMAKCPTPLDMVQWEYDVVMQEYQRFQEQYASEIEYASQNRRWIEKQADLGKKAFAAASDFIAIKSGLPKGTVQMLLESSDEDRMAIIKGMMEADMLIAQSMMVGSSEVRPPQLTPEMQERVRLAQAKMVLEQQQKQFQQPQPQFIQNGGSY